ncbi:hypothetical protein D3C79_728320 [compost metagenome]
MQRLDTAWRMTDQDLLLADLNQQQTIPGAQCATAQDFDDLATARRRVLHSTQQPGEEKDQPQHQQQPEHQLSQLADSTATTARRHHGGSRLHRGQGHVHVQGGGHCQTAVQMPFHLAQLLDTFAWADHVGQADAELFVDHYHFAVSDQRAVDQHVQRLTG